MLSCSSTTYRSASLRPSVRTGCAMTRRPDHELDCYYNLLVGKLNAWSAAHDIRAPDTFGANIAFLEATSRKPTFTNKIASVNTHLLELSSNELDDATHSVAWERASLRARPQSARDNRSTRSPRVAFRPASARSPRPPPLSPRAHWRQSPRLSRDVKTAQETQRPISALSAPCSGSRATGSHPIAESPRKSPQRNARQLREVESSKGDLKGISRLGACKRIQTAWLASKKRKQIAQRVLQPRMQILSRLAQNKFLASARQHDESDDSSEDGKRLLLFRALSPRGIEVIGGESVRKLRSQEVTAGSAKANAKRKQNKQVSLKPEKPSAEGLAALLEARLQERPLL